MRAVLLLLLALGVGLATRGIAVEWRARGVTPDASTDVAALRATLVTKPRSVTTWIRLGLELEQARETIAAEQALLEAARLDRQLLPAWTLANYYFRQNNAGEFWKWGARAAAMTYDDYRPLLRLADRLEADPEALLTRLEAGPGLTRAYLDFVIGQRRMDAAQQVVRALAEFHDPADEKRIRSVMDR